MKFDSLAPPDMTACVLLTHSELGFAQFLRDWCLQQQASHSFVKNNLKCNSLLCASFPRVNAGAVRVSGAASLLSILPTGLWGCSGGCWTAFSPASLPLLCPA